MRLRFTPVILFRMGVVSASRLPSDMTTHGNVGLLPKDRLRSVQLGNPYRHKFHGADSAIGVAEFKNLPNIGMRQLHSNFGCR